MRPRTPALLAATALACLGSSSAFAAASSLDGLSAVVDFSKGREPLDGANPASRPPARPGTYLVDIWVNGQRLPEVAEIEVRADRALVIPTEAWNAAALKPLAEAATMAGGDAGGDKGFVIDQVAGAQYALDTSRLQLVVTAPAAAFIGTRMALAGRGRSARGLRPTTPATGFHLDYDLSVTAVDDGTVTYGGLGQAVVSTPAGTLVSGAVFRGDNRRQDLTGVRTDTFWQLDLPERRQTLILGDTVSSSGTWSRPVRFGGLRFGRNFALDPDFVTFPMPTLSGSAALPSTADLLVNGNLQQRGIAIAPGPFAVTNVPTITGEGRVNLVVRDARGIETVISRSYYLAPSLLAPGLSDYSVEIGALRRNYAVRNVDYGPLLAAASWRQGLTGTLTAGARAEVQERRQAFGVELDSTLGGVIGLRLAAGYSISAADGAKPRQSGGHYLATIERRNRNAGAFIQAEYSERGYEPLGSVAGERRIRHRLQVGGNAQAVRGLNLGLRYIEQSSWNGDDMRFVAGNVSADLPDRLRLGAYFSDQLGRGRGWSLGVTLSRSFGGLLSANSSVSRDEAGGWRGRAAIGRSAPQGPGFGWHIDATADRASSLRGGVVANAAFGQFSAEGETGENFSALRLGARGSIGWLGGLPFAARPIGERAFAVVRVPDLEGITIERSNLPVARTGRRGLALVTDLLPYQANSLKLRAEDLPFNVEIGGSERTMVPFSRAGVVIDFPVRRSVNALVVLRLPDGGPVPLGAAAMLDTGRSFIVGRGGEAYLGDLAAHNILKVTWAEGSCLARFDGPTANEPEARIGPIVCEKAP